MTKKSTLDRRFFMKGATATALFGSALTTASAIAGGKGQVVNSMSTSYNLDDGYERVGHNSIKFDYIKMMNPGKELDVGMGIADMDFRTIPEVTEALKKRLDYENWGYELPPLDYGKTIADWNKRRYNADVPTGNVLNCVGVLDGVLSILKTFGKAGDKVLLHTPAYSAFFTTIHHAQMHEAESEMKLVNGRYEIDYDDFEKQVASGIKLFILCNPHNPVGNCWTADEMRKLGDICNKHGVLVIADEIHCDFINVGEKYVPYASLGEEYAMNSISLKSTSKTFNLAAHRTGYMFSHNKEYINRVRDEGGHQRLLLNIMGMIASNEAYKHGDKYVDEMQVYLTENAKYVEKYVADNIPEIKYNVHEGTYLAWLDFSGVIKKLDAAKKAKEKTEYNIANNVTKTDLFGNKSIKKYRTGDYVKEWVMDNARVDINPGENYGKGGEGFMRMNLATNRKTLELALDNIKKAIDSI